MSEAIKQIVSEFEKPVIEIPSDIMDAIQCSRLDLSQNISDPQMLVSKGNLPVCTRGNFSFVIGLPGARKSFLCSGIAGAFLNENGCMGLDNPNGSGKLLGLIRSKHRGTWRRSAGDYTALQGFQLTSIQIISLFTC